MPDSDGRLDRIEAALNAIGQQVEATHTDLSQRIEALRALPIEATALTPLIERLDAFEAHIAACIDHLEATLLAAFESDLGRRDP